MKDKLLSRQELYFAYSKTLPFVAVALLVLSSLLINVPNFGFWFFIILAAICVVHNVLFFFSLDMEAIADSKFCMRTRYWLFGAWFWIACAMKELIGDVTDLNFGIFYSAAAFVLCILIDLLLWWGPRKIHIYELKMWSNEESG